MSEYTDVERPFLEKLESLGWEVIDHGAHGIPQSLEKSLRSSFNDVVLGDVFRNSVRKIKITNTAKVDREYVNGQSFFIFRKPYCIATAQPRNSDRANKMVNCPCCGESYENLARYLARGASACVARPYLLLSGTNNLYYNRSII